MVAHEVQRLFQSWLTVWFVMNTSLISLQGFLYVFGGLLDSAYSNGRYPLWVFDIGELLCGAVWLAAVMRRATTRLHVRNIQHERSPRFPNL